MRTLLFVALLAAGVANRAWGDTSIHPIGVLVCEGEQDARGHWTPTADYLSSQIPGHRFVVVPLRQEALTRAVVQGEVEFAVTHAGHYVQLAVGYGVSAIATMQRAWGAALHSTAGTAIIARVDRPDIVWMSDLKRPTIGPHALRIVRESLGST